MPNVSSLSAGDGLPPGDPLGHGLELKKATLATFDDDAMQHESKNNTGSDVHANGLLTAGRVIPEVGGVFVNEVPETSFPGYDPPAYSLPNGPHQDFREVNETEIDHTEDWVAPFTEVDHLDTANDVCPEEVMDAAEIAQVSAAQGNAPPGAARGTFLDAAIKVHAAVKFTRAQRLRRRARWATKKLLVFILSHVGLTSLVGLYAVAGGFLFQHLERNSEIQVVPVIADKLLTLLEIRNKHIEQLWNFTESLNVLYPNEWKDQANQRFLEYEKEVFEVFVQDWKAENQIADYTPSTSKWTYPSALLFAITIITTIGYGDIVPHTAEGKIACMLYAVIGIPLVLLCLANIGSFLATVYRFTWKHANHLAYILVRSPKRNRPLVETSKVRVPISVSILTMVIYILSGAAIFSRWENWSFLEGSYFCFITLSTIGFGDYVPGKNTETLGSNAKRVVCAMYLLFGLALLSTIFQLLQDSATIVVRRYASFLGLSEKQIEKDLQEAEVKVDDVLQTKINGGIPENPDPKRFQRLAGRARELRRESCPVYQAPHEKTRLYSVPEVEMSRQIYSMTAMKMAGGLDTVTENGSGECIHEEEEEEGEKEEGRGDVNTGSLQ